MPREESYIEGETFSSLPSGGFEYSHFIECTFQSIDAIEASARGAKFIECAFEKCNFSNSNFANVTFRDVEFKNCKLLGSNFSVVKTISSVTFTSSSLDYCVFQDLSLKGTKFYDCSLREVDFSDSNLSESSFTKSNLQQTSFTNCNLTSCDFREAVNYYIEPQFTNIKHAKFTMPEAMSLLLAMDIILE